MELALFTYGAYIWPVHRNFEAFIAALGFPADTADSLADSSVYPAQLRPTIAAGDAPLPPRLDQRLAGLHRDLYDALLRPIELAVREQRSFADFFWPDLRGTAIDSLLGAFTYMFVRRVPAEMPVAAGLSVLRAVFFNHEVDEPAIWLGTAVQRLAAERAQTTERGLEFTAPGWTRVQDLAFVVVGERDRPAGGPGWITGSIQRLEDGLCHVRAEYGLGAGWDEGAVGSDALTRLDTEAQATIESVFGWRQESAA
jgi:hypothetical protein